MVLAVISHLWAGFVLDVVCVGELSFYGDWELECAADESFAQVSFEG